MRFKVSGIDSYGDRHTFESDDEERARSMHRQFLEDLEKVQLWGSNVELKNL